MLNLVDNFTFKLTKLLFHFEDFLITWFLFQEFFQMSGLLAALCST